eukprot:scaffold200460_cov17-Tisochrysis_lutea.AAC.1
MLPALSVRSADCPQSIVRALPSNHLSATLPHMSMRVSQSVQHEQCRVVSGLTSSLPCQCLQVVMVLKKEVVKTQNKDFEKGGEYRQMLVQ